MQVNLQSIYFVETAKNVGNVYYDPDEQPSGYKKVGTNSQSI